MSARWVFQMLLIIKYRPKNPPPLVRGKHQGPKTLELLGSAA